MTMLKKIIRFWVLAALVFGGLVFQWGTLVNHYGFNSTHEFGSWDGVEPLGEVVAGFRYSQKLPVPPINKLADTDEKDLCIHTKIATYDNRTNVGFIEIGLHNERLNISQFIRVNVANYKDNQNTFFCFDQFKHRILFDETVELWVHGVDSLPGRAITLWLSNNGPEAQAQINGVPTEKSLRLSVGKRIDAQAQTIGAYVLMAFFSLLVSVLLLQWWRAPRHKGA